MNLIYQNYNAGVDHKVVSILLSELTGVQYTSITKQLTNY